jgi:hypothetical protein
MNWFIDKITSILDRFGDKIPSVNFQWEKFDQFMNVLTPYLADANVIFPVDDVLVMLGILLSVRAVLFAIWCIKFIRDLLPF